MCDFHLLQEIFGSFFHPFIGYQFVIGFFFFLRRSILLQYNISVVQLNLLVLKYGNVKDGILQPKTNQEQGHAAADPKNSHEKPFFVTDQVPYCSFPDKA